MRDREEILQEMSEVRVDLAQNVGELRDAIAAKLDVRAHAERIAERARDQLRRAPRLSVVLAFGLGLFLARD